MKSKLVSTLALFALVAVGPMHAGAAGDVPPPPCIAHDSQHLLIGFEAEETGIRTLVPAGLELDSAVLVANMYQVPLGFGVTPYDRSYVWADLKGYDSVD